MQNAIKLLVQENKIIEIKPSKGKNGTYILVENLFENFPVRKKNFYLVKKQNIII